MVSFLTEDDEKLRSRILGTVEEAIAPIADELDSSEETAREVVQTMGERGLLELVVPADMRHTSLRLTEVCLAREEIARWSLNADSLFAVQGLFSYPIMLEGSGELRERYLGRTRAGTLVGAFSLTEREAGSDVGGIETTAQAEGESYRLRGVKRFTSNAGYADAYVVFARTSAASRTGGISAFVVEADVPGLATRPIHLVAEHPIGEVELSDCLVPATARLGEKGDGFRIAMGVLDFYRTTVGAAAVGVAQGALDEACDYARQRRQFGRRIGSFQAVQFMVAEMATELEAARLLVYSAARVHDEGGEQFTRQSSMAKFFASEAAFRTVDRAVQILGGNGLVRGSRVARFFRHVRPMRIYEGTSEIQRLVIARSVLGKLD
ncbi:MAG: acyl-CoA dehydrogenase family protein [Anaerolineae bacterium]